MSGEREWPFPRIPEEKVKQDLKEIFANEELVPRLKGASKEVREYFCSDEFINALVHCYDDVMAFRNAVMSPLLQAEFTRLRHEENDADELWSSKWQRKLRQIKDGHAEEPTSEEEKEILETVDEMVRTRGEAIAKRGEARVVLFSVFNRLLWWFFPLNKKFADPFEFEGHNDFKSSFADIQKEFFAVYEKMGKGEKCPTLGELDPSNNYISRPFNNEKAWKTFFFRIYGQDVENNKNECPTVKKLVEKYNDSVTTAMFSFLLGKRHIVKHQGPYKGVYRYHLGLRIPAEEKGRCEIVNGDVPQRWTEGDAILFDDTFTHEVFNDTNELRALLFLDVVRPLPHPYLDFLNRYMINIFQGTRDLQEVSSKAEQSIPIES
uniref:Aspartyl/asparaginy/proline hydroxylase domain-containing protein n=1 Tax=Palpitomonas bilix TaxID=652834 RepID=A0A7S3LXU5_9EUKA|mmetsp:Transcript_9177/g.24859  ORF Transcript_9177/g.24859 Transcript_9177/m.24859 type:complete len:378 (+) Transcript_9177:18-1151(+)